MFIQHSACVVPRLFVDSLSSNVVLLLSTGNNRVLSVGISVEMTMGGSFGILCRSKSKGKREIKLCKKKKRILLNTRKIFLL